MFERGLHVYVYFSTLKLGILPELLNMQLLMSHKITEKPPFKI